MDNRFFSENKIIKKKKKVVKIKCIDIYRNMIFFLQKKETFIPRNFFHLIENFYDVNITCNNSQGAILEAIFNSTRVLYIYTRNYYPVPFYESHTQKLIGGRFHIDEFNPSWEIRKYERAH